MLIITFINIIISNIIIADEPPIFLVNNIKDLHKIEGHLSLTNLFKGVQVPRKRKTDETVEIIEIFNYTKLHM